MKRRTRLLLTVVLALFSALAVQAQAPSSRKIPFNNVTTTITCAPDPSPCQRNVILRMFDAAIAGTQIGVDEPQTVSVDDPSGTGGTTSFVLGSTRPSGVDPNDFQSGSARFLDVLDAATLNSVLPARIELTAVAFAVNPGPQGPPGAQGPQGNPGPQGPPGVVQSVSAGDASIATGGSPAVPTVSVATNGITNDKVANGALSPAKIAGNAATLGSNNNFTGNGSFAAGLGVGDVASFSIAAAPAGATESGTLVTITTTAPHSFNINDLVTISGVAVSGYNGTFYVAVPGLSATTFTYVAPTAGLAASGGGTAVSGALLSVTKANRSPTLLLATPLLSITNSFDAEASISFDGSSGNPSTAWRVGVNRPPDNPNFFDGLFFFKYPLSRMVITRTGNVGIGTTVPAKLLDVAGDGNFNGSLSAGSFTGNGSGLTGVAASGLAAGAYGNAYTFSNAANSFTGNGSGLTALNATSLVSGTVADVRLSSNVPLLNSASNTFTGKQTLPANGLAVGGTQLVAAGGNVGVGTDTPSHKAEIVDASNTGLRVQTNSTGGTVASFGGNGAFLIDSPGLRGGRFSVSETGSVAIGPVSSASLFTVGGSGTFSGSVIANSVGIGTAAPLTALHVSSGSDTEVSVQSTATGGRRWTLQSSATGGLAGVFQIIDRTALPNASRLAIDTVGNVGIGTSTPGQALEVAGNVKATSFFNSTTSGNSIFGFQALQNNSTGASNSAFGSGALQFNTLGSQNAAFGSGALQFNTFGSLNAAFGSGALQHNTSVCTPVCSTGQNNSAFGSGALGANVDGYNNTAIGQGALPSLLHGNRNVAIGAGAGSAFTGSEFNNIDIGNTGSGGDGDTIRIGTNQLATYIAGISGATSASGFAVFVNASGQLGTQTSSRRYKEQIADLGGESNILMKLRPVAFYYKKELDSTHTRQYGLVAEEVAQIAPGLVIFDKDGAPQTVRYHFVNAMLLNEVQKQRRLIEEGHAEIAVLRDEGGVALAAIQGLNQKLEEQIRHQDEQIKQQADQIRELRQAIRQLSKRASSAD